MDSSDLLKIREKSKLLDIDSRFLSRSLNEGFSEVKKREMKFFKWLCLNLDFQYLMRLTQD